MKLVKVHGQPATVEILKTRWFWSLVQYTVIMRDAGVVLYEKEELRWVLTANIYEAGQ